MAPVNYGDIILMLLGAGGLTLMDRLMRVFGFFRDNKNSKETTLIGRINAEWEKAIKDRDETDRRADKQHADDVREIARVAHERDRWRNYAGYQSYTLEKAGVAYMSYTQWRGQGAKDELG